MKNITTPNLVGFGIKYPEEFLDMKNQISSKSILINSKQNSIKEPTIDLAEILVITSYPPRECGIATYSQDLIRALNNKF